MDTTSLRDLIDRTGNVKPIAESHTGTKVVTFADQRDLATMDSMNNSGLNLVKYNSDGTVARTPIKYAAVNPASYFINRYKKAKDTLYVVTDYRAIKEQDTGSVYMKSIPAFAIKRNDKGELTLEKVVTISDDEFLADFTKVLSREAMEQILPLIAVDEGITTDAIPI